MEIKKFILTLSCPDRLGIVARITSFLASRHGDIMELAQFVDVTTGRFFMRCVFEFDKAPLTRVLDKEADMQGNREADTSRPRAQGSPKSDRFWGRDAHSGTPLRASAAESVSGTRFVDASENLQGSSTPYPKLASMDKTAFGTLFAPIVEELGLQWNLYPFDEKPRTLILVSKEAHCLNDLLHRVGHANFPILPIGIISNHNKLKEMADWYNVPFLYCPVSADSKSHQEERIAEFVENEKIDLVVLARYMQILSPELTRGMLGKAINIHHSFLPSFKGAKPYHQAFERGVKLIGATAHFVSDELDEGPIIDQEVIRVGHAHSPEDLVMLGRDIECFVLSRAIKQVAERRVFLNGKKTVVLN